MSTPASGRASRLTLVGLIIAVSMTSIDQTIVALTGPTIEADLNLTHDAMQWAVNVYLIAAAAFFMLGGRQADLFGHKRMALIGIVAFGATSLLCGLAPAGDWAGAWLIGARALQGISGALMYPAAIGMVVETFPREGRGKAMAAFFAVTGAMTALGPVAGGVLSEWTWRAVFWVNVPLAIISMIILAVVAAPSTRIPERIDFLGAAVVAAALGLIIFGLQQAGSWGWASPWVIASLVVGLLLILVFVRLQSRSGHPLVRLQVFRDRGFVLANASLLLASVGFVSTFFFLSVYGQVTLGLNALDTGLLFLKFFIGFVIASQLGSRRFDRVGARSVLILGGVIGAAGFGWLAFAVTHVPSNPHDFFNPQTWPIMLAGAGIGFMLSAASTDAVNRSIGATYGEVTAISQTVRNFGGALGMALFATLVTQALTDKITTSFAALGAPASTAQAVVDRISGAASSAASGAEAQLPAAVQAQFTHAVTQGYAEAVSYAFMGAAVAMALVMVMGLYYPRGEVSAQRVDDSDSAAGVSAS